MNKYIRHDAVNANEVISAIRSDTTVKQQVMGCSTNIPYMVGVSSNRLKTFARDWKCDGVVCVGCGVVANSFYVESFMKKSQHPSHHLNLYGTKDGQEILFTHDHILARSLGGVDNLTNTQVMCFLCNNKKGQNEQKIVRNKNMISTSMTDAQVHLRKINEVIFSTEKLFNELKGTYSIREDTIEITDALKLINKVQGELSKIGMMLCKFV